jgi:hypothetical protein
MRKFVKLLLVVFVLGYPSIGMTHDNLQRLGPEMGTQSYLELNTIKNVGPGFSAVWILHDYLTPMWHEFPYETKVHNPDKTTWKPAKFEIPAFSAWSYYWVSCVNNQLSKDLSGLNSEKKILPIARLYHELQMGRGSPMFSRVIDMNGKQTKGLWFDPEKINKMIEPDIPNLINFICNSKN